VAEVLRKPKSALFGANTVFGPILNTCRVIVYFVYILPNFRNYDNKGWSESFFACTVKSANP